MAAERYAAPLRREEAQEQGNHSRLPGSRAPHKCNSLARCDLEGEAVQSWLGTLLVGEAHVLENQRGRSGQLGGLARRGCGGRLCYLGRGVEQLGEGFAGRARRGGRGGGGL